MRTIFSVMSRRSLAVAGIPVSSLVELLQHQEKIRPLFQEEIRHIISSEQGFKAFEKMEQELEMTALETLT